VLNVDELIGEGIMSKGYGIIPKLIMKDKSLSIEAKGIYAYIASYAGAGTTAFPSVDLICGDLQISENRFHKNKKLLIDYGYIEVKRVRDKAGEFGRNVYTIKQTISPPTLQFEGMVPTLQFEGMVPTLQIPGMDIPSMDIPGMEIEGTNNNSLNINSINNNNVKNNSSNSDDDDDDLKSDNSRKNKSEKNELETARDYMYWKKQFDDNLGANLTKKNYQGIISWLEIFDEQVVLHALSRAGLRGGKSYHYVNVTLQEWMHLGYEGYEEIIDAEINAKYGSF
jgi:DnaD/phage-associated family protein